MSTETSLSKENRPSFLAETKPEGVEGITQYIRPPRLKIVQSNSKAPFAELFNKGDLVCVPANVLVSPVIVNAQNKPTDNGTPFHFVPIFFFPEWCCHNPYELNASLPFIRERSFDINSDIARRAKDRNGNNVIPCPEDARYQLRYCEHLNFVLVMLGTSPVAGMPVVASFVRGSYKAGSNLLQLIQLRQASIFGCVFQAQTKFMRNDKGEWYGWDISNPAPDSGVSPWVNDQELFNRLRNAHLEYKNAHANSTLIVEHDDTIDEPVATSTEY